MLTCSFEKFWSLLNSYKPGFSKKPGLLCINLKIEIQDALAFFHILASSLGAG